MKLGGQSCAKLAVCALFAASGFAQADTPPPQPAPDPAANATPPAPPLTGLAPLTTGYRAKYALRRSFGPENIGLGILTSGIQTWRQAPPGWGSDWEGFAQRFGMRMSRSVVGNGIDFGVGAALGTDPRYRRLGQGSFGTRLKYALGASFYHYDSRGNRVPAVSRFSGIVGANVIMNHWMPPGDNEKLDVARRSVQQLGWHIGWTVFREFLPDVKRKLGR